MAWLCALCQKFLTPIFLVGDKQNCKWHLMFVTKTGTETIAIGYGWESIPDLLNKAHEFVSSRHVIET